MICTWGLRVGFEPGNCRCIYKGYILGRWYIIYVHGIGEWDIYEKVGELVCLGFRKSYSNFAAIGGIEKTWLTKY